jgi:hypothetical protein
MKQPLLAIFFFLGGIQIAGAQSHDEPLSVKVRDETISIIANNDTTIKSITLNQGRCLPYFEKDFAHYSIESVLPARIKIGETWKVLAADSKTPRKYYPGRRLTNFLRYSTASCQYEK